MKNKDKIIYTILSIMVLFAIVAMVIFVIIPKYSPMTPKRIVHRINFSNSSWIEQYLDKSVGLFGLDFYLETAFSYNLRSNKMVASYASTKSVEEARTYYLALPGARETGRNDETSLDITAEKDGQVVRAYNYYSPIARVFKLELTLDDADAENVINQLEKAFPIEELTNIAEIKDILSGENFGGYVRYRYDNLDEYAYPNIPIFSRAFLFDGTEDDFHRIVIELNEAYPTYKFDETQNTHYYQINESIVSLSFLLTDSNEKIVSIGIQKLDNQ